MFVSCSTGNLTPARHVDPAVGRVLALSKLPSGRFAKKTLCVN